jgi:hypothetical protein
MADGLCAPHKAVGRLVPAFYKINGEGICKSCYDGKAISVTTTLPAVKAAKPTAPQEGTVKEQKQIDWTAVQNDRSEGMKGKEIAKKYGIKEWEIYYKTKSSPNGRKPAGGAKQNGFRASLAKWRQRDAA